MKKYCLIYILLLLSELVYGNDQPLMNYSHDLTKNEKKILLNYLYKKKYYYLAEAYFYTEYSNNHFIFLKSFEKIINKTEKSLWENIDFGDIGKIKKPNIVKFLMARIFFKEKKYKQSREIFLSINEIFPYFDHVLEYLAYIELFFGNEMKAIKLYERCEKLNIRHGENCSLNMARIYFGKKEYSKAMKKYDEVKRDRYSLPQVLIEYAWIDYFKSEHQMSYGKLISFDHPSLNYYEDPEIYYLKLLLLTDLCQYAKLNKHLLYYNNKVSEYKKLNIFIESYAKDPLGLYFLLFKNNKSKERHPLFDKLMNNIALGPKFMSLRSAIDGSLEEMERVLDELKKYDFKKIGKEQLETEIIADLNNTVITRQKQLAIHVYNEIKSKYVNFNFFYKKMKFLEFNNIGFIVNSYPYSGVGQVGDEEINENKFMNEYKAWQVGDEVWKDELGEYAYLIPSKCNASFQTSDEIELE